MNLSKKATHFLVILFCAGGLRLAHADWGIGPLGGANIANAEIEGRGTRAITGWAMGARFEMGMAPILSLMLDPMLVQSGADFDANGSDVPGRGKFVFMEVPLLLNAKISLMNLGVYGFLGPDLVINADADGNVASSGDLNQADLAPFGLAGQVGAGIAMGVAPFIDVTADARYSHGFTDLLQGAKDDVRNWRNRDVRLNLGVLLHTPKIRSLVRPGNALQTR